MPVLADILARAGGGQHFNPPAPSGGGGGGGGGGFGFGLPFLFLGGGSIGFLLLLIVGMVVLRGLFSTARGLGGGESESGYSPPPTVPPMPANTGPYDDSHPIGVPDRFRGGTLPGSSDQALARADVAQGIAQIRGHDPDFDETAFLGEVERAFFVVEQAWTERKPEMSRSVMADSLWQQHKVQIQEYVDRGRRNELDGLSIGTATIVGAHHDQTYDTVTVRILAASADYEVDDRSGRMVSGSKDIRQWTEDWTFQRAATATTRVGGGTLAHKCPNCGAPLDVDLAGVCSYCKAPIMGGDYDWVLSRIDQVMPAYS